MAESLTLATLAGTNFSLINEAGGIVLVEHSYPAPSPEPFYASSADTEGERFLSTRYRNRTISIVCEVFGATSETVLANLQAHVAQIGREGGTLTWVTPGGTTVIFDLVTWTGYEPRFDVAFSVAGTSRVSMEFTAKPFGRGTPTTLADHTETTAPALVFTETTIDGDVPALGKLVIDEDDAEDQAWVIWGQQSKYYSSASSAALFIKAEDLTTQGGSTKTAGATGAYGATVVRNTDLTTSFVSVVSGQLSASSTYLSHVGTFRVFARCYCPTGNTGTVEVALEWSEGDFLRVTRNATVEYESAWEGSFRLLDLGYVSLSQVDTGTQRWEPRVIARSTVAGDELDVDWLMFVPVDEGAGEAAATFTVPAVSSFSARDEFNQTSGALTGKTLPTGGTWTGAGDADDWSVGSTVVSRTVGGADTANTGRWVYPSTPSLAAVVVSAQLGCSVGNLDQTSRSAVFARYVDTSNYLRLEVRTEIASSVQTCTLVVSKVVAGTRTDLASTEIPGISGGAVVSVQLAVFAGGQWVALYKELGNGLPEPAVTPNLEIGRGQDSVLATGGTLASGRVGLYSELTTATGSSSADNFAAWVPSADAAMFASQSLTIHYDKVRREDSGGTLSVKPSSYEGDYLLVPPTGPDSRTNRFIVKASRNVPGEGADSGTDDISARLTVTPRFLVVPS